MTPAAMTAITDTGQVRDGNEDSIAIRPELGLAVLADGMGGHLAGEVASGMAVDIVTRELSQALAPQSPPDPAKAMAAIDQAIRTANQQIYQAARARAECAGMGSTVVVALLAGDRLWVGHVGDSRLYRFRDGELAQLTQDHSVIQELVNRGLYTLEEARQAVSKNLVTRALGVDTNIVVDISEQPAASTDLYLLCSDGLNEVMSDAEIAEVLRASDELETTAKRLVACANDRGGPDNISVILARMGTAR